MQSAGVASDARAHASSGAMLALLCVLWYLSSALSSNTSKGLLSVGHRRADPAERALFPYPMTLTLVHFVFVNVFCYLGTCRSLLRSYTLARRLVRISWAQQREVAQISVFNVVGHALSSLAISRVPVSMVHTIKALSPLFTVLSYVYLFNVSYSSQIYVSLVPLMLGVVLACSSLSSSADDVVGFAAALGSTFIFVVQNIYSKNLLKPAAVQTAAPMKLDKINIMFYSSAWSIVLMLPLCIYHDIPRMAAQARPLTLHALYLLFANGVVHFAQNLLAFQVLAHVSPVTYSIANLFKRVFVILIAIVWFGQSVTHMQWVGIALTFLGLYLYNQAKIGTQAPREADTLPMHETRNPISRHALLHLGAREDVQAQARARPRLANFASDTATRYFSLPPQ
ncbi:hypothetical protein MVES1_002322 [Malassezia vespertilionis]|uniref:Sly41p n=1 Tax=Malassezia vespertilionis TaxID=2020962 RepID=A0A2N1JBG5_9BASI|nr:uncharacterized protein MVES1_002322 [Malassezia vespertilionis]PKI83862.1 Sly41p [Malassezia vespertilionis]WFD06967.1 hypothetical protein MVES1_002322 [Malassezia vespertilionis]